MPEAAQRYLRFAADEAVGSSPIYDALCRAIAGDDEIVERLDALPRRMRQPNLLLASAKLLGAPFGTPAPTLEWLHTRWSDVVDVMATHATQTNESARTGTILPALAAIPGPLALIEVGASAGLCLYPDRYRIDYGPLGATGPSDSPVHIEVRGIGPVPVPARSPDIVSRIGIDLNPLDVRTDDDMAWLEACVWPEHDVRLDRLRRAAQVVAADPPLLVRGDLLEVLPEVLDTVPDDVTPVVIHSAVLAYLDRPERSAAASLLRAARGARWISNEAPGVVDGVESDIEVPADAPSIRHYVVGVDGRQAVGLADHHGRWVAWRP